MSRTACRTLICSCDRSMDVSGLHLTEQDSGGTNVKHCNYLCRDDAATFTNELTAAQLAGETLIGRA